MSNAHAVYSDFIHKSRYARYLEADSRRETWGETVDRYIEFFQAKHVGVVPTAEFHRLRSAIQQHEIMPSMRCMMTAGPALERDHVAGYNCAYVPVDNWRVLDEIMYILLCGTGVGFSVESKYISQLSVLPSAFTDGGEDIVVADSKIGWATALRKLISSLCSGSVPNVDYGRVRPAGAILKTFGGRASGPEPLRELFTYIISTFTNSAGRKLNALEVHDIVCKIAESIVCGGVRRSALISLSDLSDERLRHSKSGSWYLTDGHRALANNSVCYTEKPDVGMFLREWTALYESRSGERGIFYRDACERGLPDRREGGHEWGTNPCSEIILRPRQFCNLTEVVARPEDTLDDLIRKVEQATLLGTMQSALTNFRYLGKKWQDNCEEERLLGVSITGIMDCPLLTDFTVKVDHEILTQDFILTTLKEKAIEANKKWARKLGIPQSTAITCVKPSGTVSQLVGSSSGIHPRYAPYYIRRVRNDVKDPVSQDLINYGVPYEIDVTNENQYVFEFPISSPLSTRQLSAMDQLELWKSYARSYCEHKPSVSIYVKEDEWVEVANWVYKNFDIMSGVSFFPKETHTYRQAPYEEITEDEYNRRAAIFVGDISWGTPELEDNTTASQELACSAKGGCEF